MWSHPLTWRFWLRRKPRTGFLRKHFGRSGDLKKQHIYIYISYRYMYRWCHEQLVWRKWDVIFHPGSRSYYSFRVAKTVVSLSVGKSMHEPSPNPAGFPMVFQCLGIGPKAYWAIQRWWHQQLVDGNGRDFYPSLCSEYPFSCLNKNLVIKWLSAPWELDWVLFSREGLVFDLVFFCFWPLWILLGMVRDGCQNLHTHTPKGGFYSLLASSTTLVSLS